MKSCQYLKFSAAVILTALAVVATATQSFAQLPGGGQTPQQEVVGGNPLRLRNTYSEARNGGHLLSVWRGADNNQVWMSRDNGTPFTIGGTVTFVSPTVVPYGPDGFLVFHTGDNGDIFFAGVDGAGTTSDTWFAVPGNFTNLPVSVVQMGPNSFNLYMVYRGLGNDKRVWGTWFDWAANTWSTAENISGGLGNSAPGVSMNNVSNRLFVTVEGTDNQLWMTSQALGASIWSGWARMGVSTSDTPHSVACANGNMVVNILDFFSHPEYAKFDAWGNQQTGWNVDTSEPSVWPLQLAANENNVYSLATLLDDGIGASGLYLGFWKQIYNCQ